MDNDQKPIVVQSEVDPRFLGPIVAFLLAAFVVVAVGLYLDRTVHDIWQNVRPWYEAIVEWRDLLVDWLRNFF